MDLDANNNNLVKLAKEALTDDKAFHQLNAEVQSITDAKLFYDTFRQVDAKADAAGIEVNTTRDSCGVPNQLSAYKGFHVTNSDSFPYLNVNYPHAVFVDLSKAPAYKAFHEQNREECQRREQQEQDNLQQLILNMAK